MSEKLLEQPIKVGISPFEQTVSMVVSYLMHDKPGLSKPQATEAAISAVMLARTSV